MQLMVNVQIMKKAEQPQKRQSLYLNCAFFPESSNKVKCIGRSSDLLRLLWPSRR